MEQPDRGRQAALLLADSGPPAQAVDGEVQVVGELADAAVGGLCAGEVAAELLGPAELLVESGALGRRDMMTVPSGAKGPLVLLDRLGVGVGVRSVSRGAHRVAVGVGMAPCRGEVHGQQRRDLHRVCEFTLQEPAGAFVQASALAEGQAFVGGVAVHGVAEPERTVLVALDQFIQALGHGQVVVSHGRHP